MKKALIIMTFSAMAAGCADNSIPKAQLPELDTTNPLLAEWNTCLLYTSPSPRDA